MIEITYSPKTIKRLFAGHKASPQLDFSISGLKKSGEAARAMERISVSGVQEKFPAVLDGGHIRLTRDGEQSTFILKPAPWDETISTRKQIPANEHLTMQIAAQVYGILVAENGLCVSMDKQLVYITRRFDVLPDGSKAEMEDFASVLGKSRDTNGKYYKYSGTYEDVAMAIRRYVSVWRIDLERFFDLIVFNYIYANGDAHLKNFSLIRRGDDYRLAPAYDLINTSLHVSGDDFGLNGGLSEDIVMSDVFGRTGHPCREDFERFALKIGLNEKRLVRILNRYMKIPALTESLIESSYLNDKMKRTYLRIIRERTERFRRL